MQKGSGRTARGAAAWYGGVLLLFSCLTIIMTWPLLFRVGTSVQDLGDPLYQIWVMRGIHHQLSTDPSNLWDGNTAYPFARSLLFSESGFSTAILAWPIQLATGNDVLTYNIMFLSTFVVLGVGMTLLVRELTDNPGAALLAGVLAAYTPYRYGHSSHLNLLSYGWIPLTLWALIRFSRRRRTVDAALATLFLTIQVLASDTIAVMALGTTALALPFLLWTARPWSYRLLSGLLISVVVPVLALLPLVVARLEVNELYGFSRDLDVVRQLSAKPMTYVSVTPLSYFWGDRLPLVYPNALFPGVTAAVGALLGLILGIRHRPCWLIFATVLGFGAFVLSLGPGTTVWGNQLTLPYRWLYDHVPGATAMRDVARFGMVALLSIQLLAGLGFASAWAIFRARLPARWIRSAGGAVIILVMLAGIIELRHEVRTEPVPRDPGTTAVYDWLATQPHAAVVEFPITSSFRDVNDILWTIRQMYFSTRHWQPIIAGYSSYLPQQHHELLHWLNHGETTFSHVNARNIGVLQDLGIRYVIIHQREGYNAGAAIATADRLPELERIGKMGDAMVYLLQPSEREKVTMSLAAPQHARVNGRVTAILTVRNDNPNGAFASLDLPPTVIASWIAQDGTVVKEGEFRLGVPAVVDPGLTVLPIHLAPPEQPGTYDLRLTCECRAPRLATNVTVEPPPIANLDAPPLILRRVTWPQQRLNGGDQVTLELEWEARRVVSTDYTLTAQLISPDNHVITQSDAIPFASVYPPTAWTPGAVVVQPVSLKVPAHVPSGGYQLLVALYDANSEEMRRLPIQLPDGSTGAEYQAGPIVVARRARS